MNDKHRGYEHSDININGVKRAAVILLVVLVVVHGGVWMLYQYWRGVEEQRSVRRVFVEPPQPIPPEPRLQVDPTGDFQSYFREQQKILNSYGWTSRGEGKVRIPIDRAMELMVERGAR